MDDASFEARGTEYFDIGDDDVEVIEVGVEEYRVSRGNTFEAVEMSRRSVFQHRRAPRS